MVLKSVDLFFSVPQKTESGFGAFADAADIFHVLDQDHRADHGKEKCSANAVGRREIDHRKYDGNSDGDDADVIHEQCQKQFSGEEKQE